MIIGFFFFFSSRRRHTRYWRDWSSDVCSSDLVLLERRIVDNAVRKFRNAAEEARARMPGRFPYRTPGLHGSRERRVGRHIAGGRRRDEGADQTPLQGTR